MLWRLLGVMLSKCTLDLVLVTLLLTRPRRTELGHGSNVRGLECQAVWDAKTKEFVLHSPTLTASKWWNGTMGRTANHAIVMAQLLFPKSEGSNEYTNKGPHTFIVQLRDMKTHKPLNGIAVGDIGPKYGYASMVSDLVKVQRAVQMLRLEIGQRLSPI